jgi:hypothetical protein
MKRTLIILTLSLAVGLAGCGAQQAELKEARLPVGKVQGTIMLGLDAAKVAELLGSPNIVTTDEKRREVWIYDKVTSHRAETSVYGTLIILGVLSAESASSQRTLTIIIKYDEEKKVRDFAYNYTQF